MTIITLTSDFGQQDPYVGIMKGVVLGINPEARLVDLTHEIAPHDILEGALALEAAVPFFPPGTVHLAVVDPGVGSSRRALGVRAGGHVFVGPDNGLFTFLFTEPGWTAVALEAPAYRLPEVSQTFHGRDIFAPAAAYLSRGVPLFRFGPEVADPIRIPWPAASPEGDALVGEVVHADRFGNLVTSIRPRDLTLAGLDAPLAVEVGDAMVVGLSAAYAEQSPGALGAIIGSSSRLELFVRDGSARARLGAGRGTRVRVREHGSPRARAEGMPSSEAQVPARGGMQS
jgi:S-adenosylmethionine hydrolase